MKILFSPSEAKKLTPNPLNSPINSIICDRDEILQKYYDIVSSQDERILGDIFGVKSTSDIAKIKNLTMQKIYHKAILMYDGVAYEALDYLNLDEVASRYIDENLLIFSNLYGVLKAGDYVLIDTDFVYKEGDPKMELSSDMSIQFEKRYTREKAMEKPHEEVRVETKEVKIAPVKKGR